MSVAEVGRMPLENELKYFESIKAELLKSNAGKFALIKGDALVGTFDTAQAAFEAGVSQFGSDEFLVKQIIENEPVRQIPALFAGVLHGPNP